MQTAQHGWEYQVIRLNIEPPVADAQPQEESRPASKGAEGAVFSEAYLKEEFPRFYDSNNPAAQQANQQADPAFQLQDFLNSQGQQG